MTNAKLTFILSIVAAVLALAAALIEYVRQGEEPDEAVTDIP